ncbi:LysR substrate-binding domain-containing protein [Billgrantia tianxiuensis]|uniref:LysR substrate-binding domain-containing protein n=1 Tax=Billgrantia tianxiuensis TaxID=2497861 RepID=UPI001F20B1C5|nr:LysR substrate-binding domain-containing protein [Halomonas tianxiuensis]
MAGGGIRSGHRPERWPLPGICHHPSDGGGDLSRLRSGADATPASAVTPEELAWYPLLHDVTAWRGGHPYAEWEHYLHAIEAPPLNVRRGYTFNRHRLALEAAIAGLGVSIARQALLTNELKTGTLIAPFAARIPTGKRYGIVHTSGALDDRRVAAVHDWIVEEAERGANTQT